MSDSTENKIDFLGNKLKNTQDYYRRYVENCENPDTFPSYITELLDLILDLQSEIISELNSKK